MPLLTKPYKYQERGMAKILRLLAGNGGALLADEMGLGKAQPLTSKLLTPTGWMRMGDVQTGDTLIGGDGRPITVTGVFPQGKKRIYRVTFRDGSSARCCADHLWKVQTQNDKTGGSSGRVLTLDQIKDGLFDRAGNARYFIPMMDAAVFSRYRHDLPLDPYLLGYILGNGCLAAGTRTEITIPDQETVARISGMLPTGTKLTKKTAIEYLVVSSGCAGYSNNMNRIMRELRMMGKKSFQKKIPLKYKWACDPEQRLAVLQGLMDSDGWAGAGDGHVEFNSSSERLAKDVVFLVQSLGGTAKVRFRENVSFTYKGEERTGLPSWGVTIRLPVGMPAFLLARKADRRGQVKYGPSRAIVSVTVVGEEECQCISVDAPDCLYVTDDFVVTHNTIQVIGVFDVLRREYPKRPMVVVCPAGLRLNWQAELKVHLGIHATILEGHKADHDLLHGGRVFVIGYDTIGNPKMTGSWANVLLRTKPFLFVADECHLLKSRGAKRTKFVLAVAKKIPNRIAVSGTPLVNRPAELWTILHMIRPDLYPHFWEFAHRYCDPQRKPWGWEFKGAVNIDELYHDLSMNLMVRRLKADVLHELPAKERHVVPLQMTNRDEYDQAHHDFMVWLKKNYRHKVTGAKKAQVLVKTGYMIRLAAKLKLPAVLDWTRAWDRDGRGKLMMFGRHTSILEHIHDAFGWASVIVTGGVPMAKRKERQALFQKSPQCRLFVGNMDAAGAGWNGTAASGVAFAELDWRPGIHLQCEDRGHRIGQTRTIQCYYLVAKDTIEDKLCGVLQEKQKVLDATLDGGDVADTLSVFDNLMEVML
jgi:hypothetical protein